MKRTVDARSPQQIEESVNKKARNTNISDTSVVSCLPSNKMAAMVDIQLSLTPMTSQEITDILGPHGDEKMVAICNLLSNAMDEKLIKLYNTLKVQNQELVTKTKETRILEIKYSKLETKYHALENRVINMELQMRRSNVVISGVPEDVGYTHDDLIRWFNKFCCDKLKLTQKLTIERIHRLGAPPRQGESFRPRPPRMIIVGFTMFQEKMLFTGARYELKGTQIFIDDDYPAEIRKVRRHLLPIAKEARSLPDMKATVRIDKLVLNGVSYSKNELHLLPRSLFPVANSSTWTDEIVGFFRCECPLSNHNPSPFVIGDESYSCVEEHLLSEEALLFDDVVTASKIRDTEDPVLMLRYRKDMHRNNPKYSRDTFEKEAPRIILEGLRAKFQQNKHCLDFLLKTGTRHIVEASPYDRFFGIGYGHRDKSFIANRDKWGQNLLGRSLMIVRDESV